MESKAFTFTVVVRRRISAEFPNERFASSCKIRRYDIPAVARLELILRSIPTEYVRNADERIGDV